MKTCWAAALGDCSDDITGEHLISKSVFQEEEIIVQGLKWCKDEPKKVGLSSLTSNILCRHHNSTSSCLDNAGKSHFEALRQMEKLTSVRKKIPNQRYWNVVKFDVKGKLFERWVLKTLINLTCNGDLPIGKESNENGRPSAELVRIVFGLEHFKGKSGLYSVLKVGEKTQFVDGVEFAPVVYLKNYIAGALFKIKGLRYVLFLEPQGPPNPLSNLGLTEDWGDSQLNFHNKAMRQEIDGVLSHKMEVSW